MTTQTVYVHLNGNRSVRLSGTTTDGTEASISTDDSGATRSVGDWAGTAGATITHAIATGDTFVRYAYLQSRGGVTKAVIPVAQTGKVQTVPQLPNPVRVEVGDLLRVMTDA